MSPECLSRPEPHAMSCFTGHDISTGTKTTLTQPNKRNSTSSLQIEYNNLSNQFMLTSEEGSSKQSDYTVYNQIIPFVSQPLSNVSPNKLNKLRFKFDVENSGWAINTALELGVGSGATVGLVSSKAILGTQKTESSHVAIKRFNVKEPFETEVEFLKRHANEIYLSCVMDHENIVQAYGTFLYNQQFHLVMEYCPTDFFKLIMANSLSSSQIDDYFIQIVEGVQYLHGQGITHRDLKIENFMISDQGVLKIIDFGFATLDRLSQGLWGSDPYMAPEIFSGNQYDSEKADIWSLAIIYFGCLNKRFPWDIATDHDAFYLQFLVDPTTLSQHLPSSSRSLILNMLSLDPRSRPTIHEVRSNPCFFKK